MFWEQKDFSTSCTIRLVENLITNLLHSRTWETHGRKSCTSRQRPSSPSTTIWMQQLVARMAQILPPEPVLKIPFSYRTMHPISFYQCVSRRIIYHGRGWERCSWKQLRANCRVGCRRPDCRCCCPGACWYHPSVSPCHSEVDWCVFFCARWPMRLTVTIRKGIILRKREVLWVFWKITRCRLSCPRERQYCRNPSARWPSSTPVAQSASSNVRSEWRCMCRPLGSAIKYG